MNEYKGMNTDDLRIIREIELKRNEDRDNLRLYVLWGVLASFSFVVLMTLVLGCDPPRNGLQDGGESIIENVSNAIRGAE